MNRGHEWITHLGQIVNVKGVSDEHLANTIQWLFRYKPDLQELNQEFVQEAKDRGLTPDFLARAPFPYKDGLGNWLVWNYETHEPMIVGTYIRG